MPSGGPKKLGQRVQQFSPRDRKYHPPPSSLCHAIMSAFVCTMEAVSVITRYN